MTFPLLPHEVAELRRRPGRLTQLVRRNSAPLAVLLSGGLFCGVVALLVRLG